MTPHQMLTVLDEAIANTRRRRDVALHLRAHLVLGQEGRPAGEDDEGALCYAYTRRQCQKMREAILAAAREDAGQ